MTRNLTRKVARIVLFAVLLAASALNAQTGNIDPSQRHAWAENAGWIQMDPAFGGVTYDGLTHQLSGWAWSKNLGWLHFRSTTPTPYGVAVTCGTLTGTVTGGGSVCAGTSSSVTVTISGGAAPYSVTLDNGGGTQSGAGPVFTFSVTPASSTTYSVVSLTDALSCVGSGSGSATVTVNPRPVTPVITAPPDLWPEESFTASVPAVAGVTYAWTVTNGTVTAGSGTREITVTAGATGPVTVSILETDLVTGCVSEEASVSMPVDFLATGFYVVTQCRLFDTRESSGASVAWPALEPGETRTFSIGARCGVVTSTVRSLAVNQTVTAPSADGELVLYRGDLPSTPITSSISYRAGKTRANNAILSLFRILGPRFLMMIPPRGHASVRV